MASSAQLHDPRAVQIFQDWRARGLSTSPMDRASAREAVEALYSLLTGAPPRQVLFFDSPRQAILATWTKKQQTESPAIHRTIARYVRGGGGLRIAIADSLRASMNGPVMSALEDFSVEHVEPEVRQEARESLHQQLRAGGHRDLESQRRLKVSLSKDLALDSPACIGWLAQQEYMLEVAPHHVTKTAPDFTRVATDFCKTSLWWWLLPEIAIACERPVFVLEERDPTQIQSEGEVLRFRDGFSVHVSRGSPIPAWLEDSPHLITHKHIERQQNIEIRRIMLERFGIARYLKESGAIQANVDDTGVLWRRAYPARNGRNEHVLMYVEVINGTAEPDGHFRHYFLRVPPWVITARQGVAWSYGLTVEEYRPVIRT